jgi:hypothetical protein
MNSTTNQTDARPYFYRPLGSSGSLTWKCAGLVGDAKHRAFYLDYFARTASPECNLAPGVRIASSYIGDRVALAQIVDSGV